MDFDVVVVGGGPAGLEAALMLGRACRRVLVCDAGAPRNAPAAHSHGLFTRDGVPPLELLRLARADLAAYPAVEIRDVRVTGAHGELGAFVVALADGTSVSTRAIVVAAGLRDLVPDRPGFRESWGAGEFTCPYCHGWELRGAPLAVLGQDVYARHMIGLIRAWTDDVVLLSDGPLAEPVPGAIVDERPVAGVEGDRHGLRWILFAEGPPLARRGLLMRPPTEPGSDLLARLGASFDADGRPVTVDPFHQTTVPGVYAAGDLVLPMPSVLLAAGSGALAGAGINAALAHRGIGWSRAAHPPRS